MTVARCGICFSFAALVAGVSGCKEQDPPPTYYTDLGDEGQPLVPTDAPVHNVKVKEGAAEWHPFREPNLDSLGLPATATSRHDEPRGDAETEKEIRKAVAEFNDVLVEGEVDEILEYFTETQSPVVEPLLHTLKALNTKLAELAGDLPEHSSAIESVRAHVAASSLLRIDIASIQTADGEATVTLERSPIPANLPGASEATGRAGRVKLFRGDDDYWYLESSVAAALGELEPGLKEMIAEIEGAIRVAGEGDAVGAWGEAPALTAMLHSTASTSSEAPAPDGTGG